MKKFFLVALAFAIVAPLLAAQWGAPAGPMTWKDAKAFCKKKGMRLPSQAEFRAYVSKASDWNYRTNYWTSDTAGAKNVRVAQPHPFRGTRFATVPQTAKKMVRCFK